MSFPMPVHMGSMEEDREHACDCICKRIKVQMKNLPLWGGPQGLCHSKPTELKFFCSNELSHLKYWLSPFPKSHHKIQASMGTDYKWV